MNGFCSNGCVNVLIMFTTVHFIIAYVIHPNKQRYNESWTHNTADNSEETIDDRTSRGIDEIVNGSVFPMDIEPRNKIRRSAPTAMSSTDGWNDCVCPFLERPMEFPLQPHKRVHAVKCKSSGEPCHRMKGAEAFHMTCSEDYTLMILYLPNGIDGSTKPHELLVPTGCSCKNNETLTK